MSRYQSYLIQRLQEAPPPGYSKISLTQVLRADRAAFTHIAESLKSLKRNPDGSKPLDKALAECISDPSVAFHLLPLPQSTSSIPERPNKRKHDDAPKGRGKSKGRGLTSKGVRVPILAKHGKQPKASAYVGTSIWRRAVPLPLLDRRAPKVCISVRSLAVSRLTP